MFFDREAVDRPLIATLRSEVQGGHRQERSGPRRICFAASQEEMHSTRTYGRYARWRPSLLVTKSIATRSKKLENQGEGRWGEDDGRGCGDFRVKSGEPVILPSGDKVSGERKTQRLGV